LTRKLTTEIGTTLVRAVTTTGFYPYRVELVKAGFIKTIGTYRTDAEMRCAYAEAKQWLRNGGAFETAQNVNEGVVRRFLMNWGTDHKFRHRRR
jgi:hypothetical protein